MNPLVKMKWRPLWAAAFCLIPLSVSAQSDDTLMLMNRLNALDTQVQTLSRQVNHGVSAAPTGTGVAAGPSSGAAAADLDVRLSQLEEQIRTLTGQVETQGNQVSQMQADMQRVDSDMQMRLSDLEAKAGGATAAPAAAAGSNVTPQAQFYSQSTPPNGAISTPQPGVLGTLPSAGTVGMTPEKQYETAYNLLGQGDYAGAQKGFEAFLTQNPKHALAANASYWLGETFYARQIMDQAATKFADSYKNYPNGAKAPDSLLKLGMALGQLGKTQEACLSFAELTKQFPAASQKIKASVTQERAHYKCP